MYICCGFVLAGRLPRRFALFLLVGGQTRNDVDDNSMVDG